MNSDPSPAPNVYLYAALDREQEWKARAEDAEKRLQRQLDANTALHARAMLAESERDALRAALADVDGALCDQAKTGHRVSPRVVSALSAARRLLAPQSPTNG